MQITIDPDIDTPIYQQIVDAVYRDIKGGRLAPGEKLPTVRELADRMKLARGTIKRAYDELGKLGAIQMTQGRGTFVLSQQEDHLGHKERAMIAIDTLLDELEELSFSPREIQIFVDLKLRARMERNSTLRVAVVDCNPEALAAIVEQLAPFQNTDAYPFLLDDVQRAPYRLGDNMDLVVTTANHFAAVEKVVPDVGRVVRVALTPAQETLVGLAKLGGGQRIGLLSASEQYARIMHKGCIEVGAAPDHITSRYFRESDDLTVFLRDKDVLVVPQNYTRFCSQRERDEIITFGRSGTVVRYDYKIDAGSFMYLEERVELALRTKKGRG